MTVKSERARLKFGRFKVWFRNFFIHAVLCLHFPWCPYMAGQDYEMALVARLDDYTWRTPNYLTCIVPIQGTSRLVASGISLAGHLDPDYNLPRLYIVEVSSGQIVGTWQLPKLGHTNAKLIDMRDGRHVLWLSSGFQSVRCWDVVDAREEPNLPAGCPREKVFDVAVGASGKILATIHGDPSESWTMRIDIDSRPVAKIDWAEYLSLSPDDSILAVYQIPNRFLLLDVQTPSRRSWLGSGRIGRAVCCWVPGRNQLAVYSLEGETVAEFFSGISQGNYAAVPAVCWLRLYDVRRTGEGLDVQQRWAVKVAEGEWPQHPQFISCDGVRIVAVDKETVIEATMDGTITGRRAVRHHFWGIGGRGNAENIWVATAEGNLLTLADALREDHPSYECGPIRELKWMSESIVWASRSMSRSYFYSISAYDVGRATKIGRWRLNKGQYLDNVSLALDQERGCAWLAAIGDKESTGIYRLPLGSPMAEVVVDGPPWEGLIDKNWHIDRSARCQTHEGNLDVVAEVSHRGVLVWLSVEPSGRVSRVAELTVPIDIRESTFLSKRGSYVALGPIQAENRDDLLGMLLVLERSGTYRVYGQPFARENRPRACAELHPNGIVVGVCEKRLICLDLVTGAQRWVVPTAEGVSACDADLTGKLVMAGMKNGVIELRRASDGSLILQRAAHDGPVSAIAFGTGGLVATGGVDGRILIWRVSPK